MPQSSKSAPSFLPMIFSLAAAASLLLFNRSPEPRPRGFSACRLPVAAIDFAAMRRRLLGLAPAHVAALLGPPRATAAAAAEDTWYYPLTRVRGAIAIRFDRTHHATAVTFVSAPV